MEHGKQADWQQARRAVLEKYPKALSGWVSGAKEYVVGADGLGCFGFGESEPEAWMDAYAETLRWDEKLAAPPVSPPDLRPLVRELETQVERLVGAINWACGCGHSDFMPPRETRGRPQPPYWWRTPLCEKAGLTWDREKQCHVCWPVQSGR